MTNKAINPVLRGNLLNIQERITELHPSIPHNSLLQKQIQKAFFLIKKGDYAESERMLALFNEIDFKPSETFKEEVFLRVQKEALSILSKIIGSELVRPV